MLTRRLCWHSGTQSSHSLLQLEASTSRQSRQTPTVWWPLYCGTTIIITSDSLITNLLSRLSMVIIRSLLLRSQPHPKGLTRQRQSMHSSRPLSTALFPSLPRMALPAKPSCLRQGKQQQLMK